MKTTAKINPIHGYEVICLRPDGGDIVEGRASPVSSSHATLAEAEAAARRWYRAGPNGPVRDAEIFERSAEGLRLVGSGRTLGPPTPCSLRATRDRDGWWVPVATLAGRDYAVAAFCGSRFAGVTQVDALAEGRRWAAARGYDVVEVVS